MNEEYLGEKFKKRPWTQQEDTLLIELVHKYGAQKWTDIASHLQGRIGKQCRERWHNHLNPDISKTPWMDYEEWLLYLHHLVYSNSWALISKNIYGRTDNNIKNHWNSNMKKKLAKYYRRLESIKSNLQKFKGTIEDVECQSLVEKKLLVVLLSNGQQENQVSQNRGRKSKEYLQEQENLLNMNQEMGTDNKQEQMIEECYGKIDISPFNLGTVMKSPPHKIQSIFRQSSYQTPDLHKFKNHKIENQLFGLNLMNEQKNENLVDNFDKSHKSIEINQTFESPSKFFKEEYIFQESTYRYNNIDYYKSPCTDRIKQLHMNDKMTENQTYLKYQQHDFEQEGFCSNFISSGLKSRVKDTQYEDKENVYNLVFKIDDI